MSGKGSKRGEWYEEGAVALHLLDVLAGCTRWVRWEWRDDGDGLDFTIGAADGGEAHFQAKHRSDPNFKWTWSELRRQSILPYAREVLQKQGQHTYHLLTDRPAPALEFVANLARSIDQPMAWKAEIESHWAVIAGDFELDLLQDPSVEQAHGWFRRIICEIAGSFIDGRVDAMAQVLAGDRATDLILRITEAARDRIKVNRSDDPWTAEDLCKVATEAGIYILTTANNPPWERLRGLVSEFINGIRQDRTLVTAIPRPEVDQIVGDALAVVPGGAVVVHGAAGEGKSEVLAAVAELLSGKRLSVLSLSLTRIHPEDPWAELNLGPDPLATLARSSGTTKAFLVLDQLDAAVWAGGPTAPLLRHVSTLLRRARRLGITAIVGCRSVDREDGRLRIILAPEPTTERPKPRPEAEIEIPRLSIPQTEAALIANLVDPTTLTNEVLTLARRPLWLRFIVTLAGNDSRLERVRTHLDLVREFWGWTWHELRMSGLDSDANTVLEELTNVMEQAGTMRVARSRISSKHEPVVSRLRSLGIVSVEPRHLRFSHQTLVDYLLAERWFKEVTDGTSLKQRIGLRGRQNLFTSNRLRLLVPLLLLDPPNLLPTIHDLVAGEALRPLVRLGIFQALAAVDQPEDLDRAGPIVLHWLDQPDRRWRVLGQVVYGRSAWVRWLASHDHDAYVEQNWLDRACKTAPNASERAPIWRVLSSLGPGDPVADRMLHRWVDRDPTLLQEADPLFWHEPQALSDSRFELYLRRVGRSQSGRDHKLKWPVLMAERPERATRLLVIILSQVQDVRARDEALDGLPRRHPEASGAGASLLHDLLPWWANQAEIRPPATGWVSRRLHVDESVWSVVCDLLAHVAAQGLVADQIAWNTLVSWLPSPLRYQDRVLLLRVGVALADVHPRPKSATCRAAADWFLANPDAWVINDGTGHPDRWRLPGNFLAEIAKGLDEDEVRRLAVAIVDHPEPTAPYLDKYADATSYDRMRLGGSGVVTLAG